MLLCCIENSSLDFVFSIKLDPFEMVFLSTPSLFLSVAYQVKNTCGFGFVFSSSLCSLIQLGFAFLPQITENTNKWRFFFLALLLWRRKNQYLGCYVQLE